jgi:hypothetical protein
MAVQLCQSVVAVGHGTQSWPCTLAASTVLHGIHLCGTHRIVWTRRLEAGQKIRIHPDRALPDQVAVEVLELRQCRSCGQSKTIEQFYRTAHGTTRVLDCAVCFNEHDRRRKRLTSFAVGAQPTVSPFSGAGAQPVVEAASALEEYFHAPPVNESGGAISFRRCSTVDCTRPAEARTTRCLECQLNGRAPALPTDGPALRRTPVWLVPFECLLCGRPICEVKVATETAQIQLRSGVRCRHCQGAPIRGEARRQVLPEVVDMGESHRGRPTTAMVAARAEQTV